jgi:hypothetical protein
MNPVTRLLVAARSGEADAAERLLDAVYAELQPDGGAEARR